MAYCERLRGHRTRWGIWPRNTTPRPLSLKTLQCGPTRSQWGVNRDEPGKIFALGIALLLRSFRAEALLAMQVAPRTDQLIALVALHLKGGATE
jgi:hypothetical protein